MEDTTIGPLREVFEQALTQVAKGKGQHRHGHGRAFNEQDWALVTEAFSNGFLYGQALKKMLEARRMDSPMSRRHELLGAINYIAMIILHEDYELEKEAYFENECRGAEDNARPLRAMRGMSVSSGDLSEVAFALKKAGELGMDLRKKGAGDLGMFKNLFRGPCDENN